MRPLASVVAGLNADDRATTARGWAANLALFRIGFLGLVALPWALRFFHWATTILPHLPTSVWAPVSFYQLIPQEVLGDVPLVRTLALANIALVTLGLIGFQTRLCTGLAAIVSFYLFGLMENFGKVDHFHHVVWFMALLAAGPSGGLMSIDALVRAKKGADQGRIEQPFTGLSPLWTLRYVWVLLGLLYLGPGLAKLASALTEGWAGATNLRNIFLRKWLELMWYDPGFTLPPRVDRLPGWLIETFGWGAILFECGFILMVVFRCFRPTLALAGIAFHVGNGLFLGIWFTTLLPAYVGLLDWAAAGKAIFRRPGRDLFVVYDGGCQLCRRTIAILRSVDLFDALVPVAGLSDDPRREQFSALTDEMLVRDLYAVRGSTHWGGYDAYAQIARRIIVLWPLALIMWLPPVAAIGRRIYRRIADSRHCVLPAARQPARGSRPAKSYLLHVTGLALVIGQLTVSGAELLYPYRQGRMARSMPWLAPTARAIEGINRWKPDWPFALYPTFSGTTSGLVEIFEVRWILTDGREQRASPAAYATALGNPGLIWNVMTGLAQDPDETHCQTQSLALARSLWPGEPPKFLASVVSAKVYRVHYRLQSTPGLLSAPLDETLFFTFPAAMVSRRGNGSSAGIAPWQLAPSRNGAVAMPGGRLRRPPLGPCATLERALFPSRAG